MSDRYFAITFPENLVREPLLYSLVRHYGLVPHVIKASVTSAGGWLVVRLSGEDGKIDSAALDLSCRGALVREGGEELAGLNTPVTINCIRVRLVIPAARVNDPIYSDIIQKHDVVINIRQANIDSEKGVVDMEISGDLNSIDDSIEFLKKRGIAVNPIEGNVIE